MKKIFVLLLLLTFVSFPLTACKSTAGIQTTSENTFTREESVNGESEDGYFLPGRITILNYEGEVRRTGTLSYADGVLTVTDSNGVRCTVKLDEEGNPVQEIVYDQNGDVLRTERIYEGNLLRTEHIYDNDKQVSFAKYDYDENGNELSMKRNGWYAEGRKCEYDENGNRTVKILYDETGKESLRYDYVYDKQGRLIREDKNGRLDDLFDYDYSYDEQGRLERTTRYFLGMVEYVGINTYDEEGRLIDQTWTDSEGYEVYDRNSYLYDESGNLVQELYYADDSAYPCYETTYSYDEDGNRTERLVWTERFTSELEEEKIIKEGSRASDFFRVNITEKGYQAIRSFLETQSYVLP